MNRPAFQPVLRDQTAWFQPLSTDKRMAAAIYQMKPSDAGTCVWDSDQLLPYIWTGQSWSVFSIGGAGGGGVQLAGDLGNTETEPRVIDIVNNTGATFLSAGGILYMRDVNIAVGGDAWHTFFIDSSESTPDNPQVVIGNAGYTYAFLTDGI